MKVSCFMVYCSIGLPVAKMYVGGMWYVVAFFFFFFRGREGGNACIGSLSKSWIHDFHGECFCLKTESKGLRRVYKKRQVESSFC